MSEDTENIVMGIHLLTSLDDALYYDGICSCFVEESSGNWF